jgi:hypothetical protein
MKTHAANGFDAIVVGSGLGWLTALALALYGCLPIEARCVS